MILEVMRAFYVVGYIFLKVMIIWLSYKERQSGPFLLIHNVSNSRSC